MSANEAVGDCFSVALTMALAMEHDDVVVCHGEVWHPETGWHGHAWVEYELVVDFPYNDADGVRLVPVATRIAVDHSNGNRATLPAGAYRNIGRARDVVEYPINAAARLAVDHGHYGPWPIDV